MRALAGVSNSAMKKTNTQKTASNKAARANKIDEYTARF
jgi:hypothetical protein